MCLHALIKSQDQEQCTVLSRGNFSLEYSWDKTRVNRTHSGNRRVVGHPVLSLGEWGRGEVNVALMYAHSISDLVGGSPQILSKPASSQHAVPPRLGRREGGREGGRDKKDRERQRENEHLDYCGKAKGLCCVL